MNPTTVNPADLPLRDIHLPHAISWWPPAPGWWLLLVVLIVAAWLGWWWLKQRQSTTAVFKPNIALRELDQLLAKHKPNSKALLRELSILLRRVAISHYGRERVSGYTGAAWVAFLNETAGKPLFQGSLEPLLVELPYRPEAQVETAAFVAAVREWIKVQRERPHV